MRTREGAPAAATIQTTNWRPPSPVKVPVKKKTISQEKKMLLYG